MHLRGGHVFLMNKIIQNVQLEQRKELKIRIDKCMSQRYICLCAHIQIYIGVGMYDIIMKEIQQLV